ncbi:MAG: metal ABC transporter substrate-binding protein, partial [Actinomycetota bacterium]
MSTFPSVRRLTVTLLALALVLAGCGAQGDEPDDGQVLDGELGATEPSDDQVEDADATDGTGGQGEDGDADGATELSVVAAVAPVADLVQQVGGDRVEVTSLVPAGADAHTYEPRPQDVVALSEADAYLGIGLGLNAAAVQLAEDNLPEGAPVVRLGELSLDDEARLGGHTHDGDEDGHSHDDGEAEHT